MSIDSINFSRPEPVETRFGIKYVRKWVIPSKNSPAGESFWEYWKANKNKMLARDFYVSKNASTGKWELQEWKLHKKEFKEYKRREPIEMVSVLEPKELSDKSGLRSWQIPAAEQLSESIRVHGSALDGSDTGVGKTYSAIAVARELGMKLGIVCPKSVIESWKRTINNHFKMEYTFVHNYEAIKGGKYPDLLDKVRKDRSFEEEFVWNVPKDTLIVFDESHRLKGNGTINAEMAKSARRQNYKILCCSATNAINPIELNAVGYILGLHKGNFDFYRFLRDHDCEKSQYSWEFGGDKYFLKKLHRDIFLDRGVRIVKEDIPDFPESEIITEPYSMDDEITEEINKIYFLMNKELTEIQNKITEDKRKLEMVVRLRNRQKIELLKVPLLIEMTEDLLDDGHSVVIMVNFSETIKSLSKKLKTNCVIWGENKEGERQKNLDDFQADKQRVIIMNIAAGGVGVSLHDLNGNHPRVALISPNDSAPMLRQAFGRVHRDGAKTKSQQRVIFIANTVEEDVCNNVKMKLKNLDLINDGDLNPKYEGMLRE